MKSKRGRSKNNKLKNDRLENDKLQKGNLKGDGLRSNGSNASVKLQDMACSIQQFLILVASFYFLAMFTIFPLYTNGKYNNMANIKLVAFFLITYVALAFAVMALLALGCLSFRRLPVILKDGLVQLPATDKFVLFYVVAIVASFWLSDYRAYAWLGSNGWRMGLVTMLTICATYFLVSRRLQFEKYFPAVLLTASFAVFLLGVVQRLGYNPFSLYDTIRVESRPVFLSTLGNNNWFANYWCVTFPLGMFLFCRKNSKNMFYLMCAYIMTGIFAMISMKSDSAYLGIAGVFLFLLWFSYDSYESMKKWVQLVLACMVSLRLYGVLHFMFRDTAEPMEPLSGFLCNGVTMFVATLLVGLVYYMVFLCEKKGVAFHIVKRSRVVIYTVVGVFLVALIVLLLLVNTTDLLNGFASLQNNNFLKFDDEWGNGRGKIWMHATQVYQNLSIREKVFGIGPDAFMAHSYNTQTEFMQATWDRILTNAHSEGLTSLINIGLLGTIAYYGIFISSIVSSIKNKDRNPIMLGFAVCVIAYVFNNMVSFQQIISTPLAFLHMAAIRNLHGGRMAK